MKHLHLYFYTGLALSALIFIFVIVLPGGAYSTPTLLSEDVSYLLPSNGTFSSGTTGWSAFTSGGGQIISYPLDGWVGLRCAPGKSVKLQTWNTSSTTAWTIDLRNKVRDKIQIRARIRGNSSLLLSRRRVSGLFWMTAQGANFQPWSGINNDSTTIVMTALSTDSNFFNWSGTTDWTWLSMSFTPPHQDWWEIRNLQFMYSSNSTSIGTSEIQIDRVQLIRYQYQGLP